MIVSTRGRYALRVMMDLAENENGGYIPMATVAKRQGISLKYLEQILPVLTKNGMIEGVHGKGGGYRLCKKADEYKVGDILRLTEGSLAPVTCVDSTSASACPNGAHCKNYALWYKLNGIINDYLDSVTLKDVIDGNIH